ncbi:hypothetical protein ACQ4LE_007702 [Meloidogyne hapla]
MEGFVVLQYGQGDFLHWLDGGLRGAPVWTGGFLHWLDGGLRSAPVWTGGFFALARWRLRGAPVWTGSFPTLALLQQCIIFMHVPKYSSLSNKNRKEEQKNNKEEGGRTKKKKRTTKKKQRRKMDIKLANGTFSNPKGKLDTQSAMLFDSDGEVVVRCCLCYSSNCWLPSSI